MLSGSATRPAIHRRLFTWRNAILGGVAAFALLGVAVAGYFVMRVTGIGPVASLAAQGVIAAGEPIIIAEFENTSNDPSLGDVVTEALRMDLAGSPALTPLAPSRIQEVLRLMQRSPDERLTPGLAREVAVREGIRAVLEGEVASAGSGYLLLAALRAPEGQELLATFRRTARSPDEVIDAIDKLSQDIREKAGESLKSIRAGPPLARVTTPSLEALRKYVEAERLHIAGDVRRALELAREAVALDSTFAMAYRTERRCPRCFTFELAALYARTGQMQQAAAAWEEVIARPEESWLAGLTTPLAHERLGEAYEAMGEKDGAAQHYARFAELWKDADLEFQPRVRYARERAAALLAERG